MLKGKTFVQLTNEERSKIEVLLHQGFSYSRIASLLGRSISTVSREVGRNGSGQYFCKRAQLLTDKRHRLKRKHSVFDHTMKLFISENLRTIRLSPELIAVQGKKLRADFICAEWIYRWIWRMKFSQKADDKPFQALFKYLRHAGRKRKRGNKRNNRGNLLQRVWIDERPECVELRQRKGDLECDIMLGKDRKPGLLVALDRISRRAWLRRLKTKNARYVATVLQSICRQCGRVKSITFDNDQSFAEHYRLHELGIKTYFTHPYSSQEKGSVENRIGLIRMFFPKQSDFSKISSREVKKVESIINERPMRMFNYKTPNQLYEKS